MKLVGHTYTGMDFRVPVKCLLSGESLIALLTKKKKSKVEKLSQKSSEKLILPPNMSMVALLYAFYDAYVALH